MPDTLTFSLNKDTVHGSAGEAGLSDYEILVFVNGRNSRLGNIRFTPALDSSFSRKIRKGLHGDLEISNVGEFYGMPCYEVVSGALYNADGSVAYQYRV